MADEPVFLGPVIVTGGCGLTGSHLVDHLLEPERTEAVAFKSLLAIFGMRYQVSHTTLRCGISFAKQVQAGKIRSCGYVKLALWRDISREAYGMH